MSPAISSSDSADDGAPSLVGLLKVLCSPEEMKMRQETRQLDRFELALTSTLLEPKPNHLLCVKKYHRSAADKVYHAEDIRTFDACLQSMNHLVDYVIECDIRENVTPPFAEICQNCTFVNIYSFFRDRTRAIRVDLHLQQPRSLTSSVFFQVHEQCLRFEFLSMYLLRRPGITLSEYDDKFGLKSCSQTMEPLLHAYSLRPPFQASVHCAAVYRYVVLLQIGTTQGFSFASRWPKEVLSDPLVQWALRAAAAFDSEDYVRFLRMYREADFLSAVLIARMVDFARYRILCVILRSLVFDREETRWTMDQLQDSLCIVDFDFCKEFLEYHGLWVDRDMVRFPRRTGVGQWDLQEWEAVMDENTVQLFRDRIGHGLKMLDSWEGYPRNQDCILITKFNECVCSRAQIIRGLCDPVSPNQKPPPPRAGQRSDVFNATIPVPAPTPRNGMYIIPVQTKRPRSVSKSPPREHAPWPSSAAPQSPSSSSPSKMPRLGEVVSTVMSTFGNAPSPFAPMTPVVPYEPPPTTAAPTFNFVAPPPPEPVVVSCPLPAPVKYVPLPVPACEEPSCVNVLEKSPKSHVTSETSLLPQLEDPVRARRREEGRLRRAYFFRIGRFFFAWSEHHRTEKKWRQLPIQHYHHLSVQPKPKRLPPALAHRRKVPESKEDAKLHEVPLPVGTLITEKDLYKRTVLCTTSSGPRAHDFLLNIERFLRSDVNCPEAPDIPGSAVLCQRQFFRRYSSILSLGAAQKAYSASAQLGTPALGFVNLALVVMGNGVPVQAEPRINERVAEAELARLIALHADEYHILFYLDAKKVHTVKEVETTRLAVQHVFSKSLNAPCKATCVGTVLDGVTRFDPHGVEQALVRSAAETHIDILSEVSMADWAFNVYFQKFYEEEHEIGAVFAPKSQRDGPRIPYWPYSEGWVERCWDATWEHLRKCQEFVSVNCKGSPPEWRKELFKFCIPKVNPRPRFETNPMDYWLGFKRDLHAILPNTLMLPAKIICPPAELERVDMVATRTEAWPKRRRRPLASAYEASLALHRQRREAGDEDNYGSCLTSPYDYLYSSWSPLDPCVREESWDIGQGWALARKQTACQ
eukprot:GEMP01001626.1.p1 GENE.GEMP01001626.1~~GEMP01001626.1.p1  ORF type:complete len:1090 (+),score=235.37 GEMP01001626.1:261-3530(+)